MRPKRGSDAIMPYNGNNEINTPLPEDRISEQCITDVAKQLGLSENIVGKLHDFQWGEVKEATDNFQTIYVSKFFSLALRPPKVNRYINNLKKDQVKLAGKWANSELTVKWDAAWKVGQIDDKIERLRKQLNKCKTK